MTPEERAFNKARAEAIRGRTALLVNTRDEIVRLLKAALDQVQVILAGQPTDYQAWSLPRLTQEIRQTLAKFGEDAATELSTAAGKGWQLGFDLVDKPLAAAGIGGGSSAGAGGAAGATLGGIGASGIGFQLGAIDTRQLQAMRAFMTDRIRNVGLAAANQINTQLGLVVIGAQSPWEAIGATRAILHGESRSRVTTIVRTELSRVYAVASFERLKQQAAYVPGLKKQWIKSGKFHPRPHHDRADQQIKDINEPFVLKRLAKGDVEEVVIKMMFPHDPTAPPGETINCGCAMQGFMSSWKAHDRELSPGGLDKGPSVRELLDGVQS